jgi:hypothetical protein
MSSSGIFRAAFVRSDVSEERIASIIKVTRIGELGRTFAVTGIRSTLPAFLCNKLRLLVTAKVYNSHKT